MTHASFDAYFRTSDLARFGAERRGGGAMGVRLIRTASPAHDTVDPATPDLVVGLMLGGTAGANWAWDGAAPNRTRSRRPGTLGLTPPGAVGTFSVRGASEMLIVVLPLERLANRLAPGLTVPRDFGRLHDRYTDQPAARQICQRLWRAAAHGARFNDDLLDTLSERLLVVLAMGATGREPEPVGSAGLSAREVAAVLARADADDADVSDLALAAGLPVRSFRRRFARTLGVRPHEWLMGRRLDRARDAVLGSDDPLADVAAGMGFASQSHMTSLFARRFGTTPARLRGQRSPGDGSAKMMTGWGGG